MRYFKQVDFDKCMEFLEDRPDTVETQQELYKFMREECHIMPYWEQTTVKDMCIYSKVYKTKKLSNMANWCCAMSDGSQVIWNRKYQKFYWIDAVGMEHCDCTNYLAMFPELSNIDKWLLENWSNWRFQETQKQLIAIWNGKYDQYFKNYLR